MAVEAFGQKITHELVETTFLDANTPQKASDFTLSKEDLSFINECIYGNPTEQRLIAAVIHSLEVFKVQDQFGNTVLHYLAINRMFYKAFAALLSVNLDPDSSIPIKDIIDVQNIMGLTPLEIASTFDSCSAQLEKITNKCQTNADLLGHNPYYYRKHIIPLEWSIPRLSREEQQTINSEFTEGIGNSDLEVIESAITKGAQVNLPIPVNEGFIPVNEGFNIPVYYYRSSVYRSLNNIDIIRSLLSQGAKLCEGELKYIILSASNNALDVLLKHSTEDLITQAVFILSSIDSQALNTSEKNTLNSAISIIARHAQIEEKLFFPANTLKINSLNECYQHLAKHNRLDKDCFRYLYKFFDVPLGESALEQLQRCEENRMEEKKEPLIDACIEYLNRLANNSPFDEEQYFQVATLFQKLLTALPFALLNQPHTIDLVLIVNKKNVLYSDC